MNPEERRIYPRVKIDTPVKFKIVDKETGADITNYTDSSLVNVSQTGICLNLPKGWICPECNRCLGWAYNRNCQLTDNNTKEVGRTMAAKTNLKILLTGPFLERPRPVDIGCDCVWVESNDSDSGSYKAGMAFSATDRGKVSALFSQIP